MTSKTSREITWAGGIHTFDLGDRWVRRVLDYRGIRNPMDTPAACLQRFEAAQFNDTDIERVIELGLLGGGASEKDVEDLLDQHVRSQPIASNAILAHAVLNALIYVGDAEAAINAEVSA
ncbi:gene transfer agent family protein [Bradyrhizobium sp. WSM 1704]|uniref:GTA-gp10 family protein n=1 Tax=Bradyrhizobium semiaridum TaxID=2821404 RepID=UPI001CE3518C|nr:GTA-gp10 family protein [Bradyrhizobium semiaridum]MCA6124569.1 gene transfer agent family protein [Bradyrhizobium semiaridum]